MLNMTIEKIEGRTNTQLTEGKRRSLNRPRKLNLFGPGELELRVPRDRRIVWKA